MTDDTGYTSALDGANQACRLFVDAQPAIRDAAVVSLNPGELTATLKVTTREIAGTTSLTNDYGALLEAVRGRWDFPADTTLHRQDDAPDLLSAELVLELLAEAPSTNP